MSTFLAVVAVLKPPALCVALLTYAPCCRFGETALHKVARFVGQDPRALGVLQVLVKNGAEVSISGAHGTPYELVPEAHRSLVADILPAPGMCAY